MAQGPGRIDTGSRQRPSCCSITGRLGTKEYLDVEFYRRLARGGRG